MSINGPLLKLSCVGGTGKNFLMRDLAKDMAKCIGESMINAQRVAF